jgi:hypothetical protein
MALDDAACSGGSAVEDGITITGAGLSSCAYYTNSIMAMPKSMASRTIRTDLQPAQGCSALAASDGHPFAFEGRLNSEEGKRLSRSPYISGLPPDNFSRARASASSWVAHR